MPQTLVIILAVIAIGILGSAAIIASLQAQAISAFQWGYNNGRTDRLNGNDFNSYCNPTYGDSFCASYKLVYDAGWTAAPMIYGGQQ